MNWKNVLQATSSWNLFRRLFLVAEPSVISTPLFSREVTYPLLWQHAVRFITRLPTKFLLLPLLLYIGVFALTTPALSTYCSNGLLLLILPFLLLFPSLGLWIFPLGLTLAPIVAREREQKTWEILLAIPDSAEDILINKVQGALWQLRQALIRLFVVQIQIVVVCLLGVGAVIIISDLLRPATLSQSLAERNLLCAGNLVVLAIVISWFLLDRAQQMVLMVAAALAVSASVSSLRTALIGACTAVLVAWGLEIGIAFTLLGLQLSGNYWDRSFSLAATIMFGPPAGYLSELDLPAVLITASITFVLRELAIRGLWQLAVRGAEKL